MKISLDKKTGFALACGQVASNPRVIERNRPEVAVFLRPQYERTVGCGGNTTPRKREYPRRSLLRFETPGNLKVAISKNNRGNTMRKANVVDVVDCCVYVLEFLSEVAAPFPAPQTLQLSYKAQSGLSQILVCISDRLSAASAALSNKQTEMEVY
jgi:hypothetical protein